MAGVIRIQPDMMQAGSRWFPVPYVLLLRDLARINAGWTLPRIPQTATEASVRLATERRRELLARAGPLVARPLHALADRLLVADFPPVVRRQEQDAQHVEGVEGGHTALPVPLPLGTVLGPQGLPVGGGSRASNQQHSHQDPGQ